MVSENSFTLNNPSIRNSRSLKKSLDTFFMCQLRKDIGLYHKEVCLLVLCMKWVTRVLMFEGSRESNILLLCLSISDGSNLYGVVYGTPLCLKNNHEWLALHWKNRLTSLGRIFWYYYDLFSVQDNSPMSIYYCQCRRSDTENGFALMEVFHRNDETTDI